MNAIEQAVEDALADGRITDDDAEAVRDFAEFLRCAGSPAREGDSIMVGPLRHLEHRPDLIRYTLGVE